MGNASRSVRRTALFPGTFDPVTRGHLDIMGRALMLCDELIVAVADRHHKQTLFGIEERIALIEEGLPQAFRARAAVRPFRGLLVEFARSAGVRMIVRGLRVISDFEYEFQMALMNKRLWAEIETVFLMPGEDFIYLNSTLVKEVARNGGATDQFVTPNVARALRARFGEGAA
ncbi:MAG: pantetheine-phosphate adenylyltransferase [Candidatus Eisenbacteria bacterium]|nr:pantetheine-phosphate adenylyltransferase [Candidatus Eisenbacteria bacterium]